MSFHEHHFQCCFRYENFQYCRRSLGCCHLDLTTVNPFRSHLCFHAVGYDYEYLGVVVTVSSNVVACNGVLGPFTNRVHLFTFRVTF
ncbi:hypothetical protein HanXRQr2_Chr16g0758881 [Helianthus annuus]|uniref:Uncharacterized protein n=1 Tax=Helianthus annuus TaxID=4232 RepID=A0A9K3GYR5_HELAN|nr:hypothetical protein HanXRQr2_Chr16g0758881 [Helianthus annuus]